MTEDQAELLLTARDSLKAAEVLLREGFPGFAASRAYYAMFYVAEAFLEGEGLSYSKHSAVIAAFGDKFAHAGKVPTEFHRFLLEAQEARHDGDYGPRNAVSPQQARERIRHAGRFLELATQLIGPLSSENANA
jgi:uncharacterized protein (UPF0332 family)